MILESLSGYKNIIYIQHLISLKAIWYIPYNGHWQHIDGCEKWWSQDCSMPFEKYNIGEVEQLLRTQIKVFIIKFQQMAAESGIQLHQSHAVPPPLPWLNFCVAWQILLFSNSLRILLYFKLIFSHYILFHE